MSSSTRSAKPHPSTNVEPLFHPAPDHTLASDGAGIAAVSAAIGAPLMPWQRSAVNVATERNADGSFKYKIVVVTVPRQAGKTTLIRAVGLHRMLTRSRNDIFYTAQTGKDARDRWNDLVKAIKASPAFVGKFRVFKAAGQEKLILENESAFRVFSPTATALHGYTPSTIFLDEAFAYDEQRGNDLMAAIVPAQITLPDKQLWIVSTAGTNASVFLRQWVDTGRAGDDPDLCYIEYGVPDGLDVFDPDVLRTYHPAVGHTQTVESILSVASTMSESEYRRAFANQWTATETTLISPDLCARAANSRQQLPDAGTIVLSFDVNYHRTASTVMASWLEGEALQQRILMHQPGADWLLDAIPQLRARFNAPVIADDGGHARYITDALTRKNIHIDTISTREASTAFSLWLNALETGQLYHDGTDQFRNAILGIVTRPVGDSALPSRRHSPADISPVIAGIAGAWRALRAADDKPLIYLGGR